MLVLTRKSGESVAIGDDITIKVIEIQGGQVRLGIEAPHSTPVHREEVLARIKAEMKRAAESGAAVGEMAKNFKTRNEERDRASPAAAPKPDAVRTVKKG